MGGGGGDDLPVTPLWVNHSHTSRDVLPLPELTDRQIDGTPQIIYKMAGA